MEPYFERNPFDPVTCVFARARRGAGGRAAARQAAGRGAAGGASGGAGVRPAGWDWPLGGIWGDGFGPHVGILGLGWCL